MKTKTISSRCAIYCFLSYFHQDHPVSAFLATCFIHVSVPLSLNSIFEEVMKSEAGRSMTLDRVRDSLVQLGCPSSMVIDDSYSIGTVYPMISFQLFAER